MSTTSATTTTSTLCSCVAFSTRTWCRIMRLAVCLTSVWFCPASPAVDFAALVEEAAEQAAEPTPRVDFDPTMALAQIGDPAIETVDEMTVGASPGSGRTVSPGDNSFANELGRRFANIQDPAIETVDEQTVGGNDHSGEKEWYEKINIRGYTQFRINDTLWYDPDGAGPYSPGIKQHLFCKSRFSEAGHLASMFR